MLTKLSGLPTGTFGFEAQGKVSRDDYTHVVRPLLGGASKRGERLRFLFQFGPAFEGFTTDATWDDFKLGIRYLGLVERCAVVTDLEWIQKGVRVASALVPCPVQTFANAEVEAAKAWLWPPAKVNLSAQLQTEKGVLVIEPHGPVTAADFDYLTSVVDPWLEEHQKLNGVVVHAKAFPGWDNFGGFVRHLQFVREHHQRVERVAVVADGLAATLLPRLGSFFVRAKIKSFRSDDVELATAWCEGKKKGRKLKTVPLREVGISTTAAN